MKEENKERDGGKKKKEKEKKGGGGLQFVPAVPKNKCPEASTIYPSAAVHVEATYWEEVSWSWP